MADLVLGLSLLKASAEAVGFKVEIRYANLEFAKQIGRELYIYIAERLPHDLLLGEYIFSHLLFESENNAVAFKGRQCCIPELAAKNRLSPSFLQKIPALTANASLFVSALTSEIAKGDFDVVGFTTMFHTVPSLTIAKAIKKVSPTCKTILGGANCTGEMGLALHESFSWIDFVCRGEGEQLFPSLLSSLPPTIQDSIQSRA